MESGTGKLDYGANHPTGGTKKNTGKINPQGPTAGTENYNPGRKKAQQTTAHDSPLNDGRNAQDWTSRNLGMPTDASGNFATSPVSPNAGDIQDESGDLTPGASATAGAGNWRPRRTPQFSLRRCGQCRLPLGNRFSIEQ